MEETKEVTKETTGATTGAPGAQQQVVRQTTSASNPPVASISHRKAHYYVYYILGILELLLAFRLVLKLTGANPISGFVSFIYAVSGVFQYPFQGIFRTATTQGIETKAMLEPSTIVAMIVYLIVAWIIARFIEIKATGKSTNE